jgi:hypothetical protein
LPDLSVAFPMIYLILSCNLYVLAAMVAGRAETGSAVQVLALIGEIVTSGLAVVSLIILVFATQHGVGVIEIFVGLILGLLLAVVLVFLEYMAVGRRSRFGIDLRGALWLTPLGVRRF